MKIYMRYSVPKCRSCHAENYYSKEKICGYTSYDNNWQEDCEHYSPDPEYKNYVGPPCVYYYSAERVIAKEIKNLEINEEHVKIGRQKYDLHSVEVLKVDYGDGFVTEYGEEETAKHGEQNE